MSSEEPDLPVAADVDTVADGVLNENDLHAVLRDEEIVEEGDELVKKGDAEAAIAKERSRKYDEGFFEGRQSREEEILDKIKDKREKFNNGRSNEYPQTVLTEPLQKIRRSVTHD